LNHHHAKAKAYRGRAHCKQGQGAETGASTRTGASFSNAGARYFEKPI
jgi:hypothetical protein